MMMGHPPLLQPPGANLAPQGRISRLAAESPIRQCHTDDIISHLTPRAAVDAFRNPTGALQACMDASTPAEQTFALRAATASKNILEWLEELSTWPWPTEDSSAGFERPPPKRRKLFHDKGALSESKEDIHDTLQHEKAYMGSLLATEVSHYERRIDDICRDMEELDVEEIKTHVLHNHIMPLSRPGTPMLDSKRSMMSPLSAYVHLDDLAALITATILQALPNLSRLTRLLNTWSVRLAVLRKSSSFLTALEDAELALKSGWKAVDFDAKGKDREEASDSTLSRNELDAMKLFLQRKISKTGQHLDYMLDALEGREETLPEDWVDRMDALEREYGEWVAACERTIRESESGRLARGHADTSDASPVGSEEEAASERRHQEDMASPRQDSVTETVHQNDVPSVAASDTVKLVVDQPLHSPSGTSDTPGQSEISPEECASEERGREPLLPTGQSGTQDVDSPAESEDSDSVLDMLPDIHVPEPELPTIPSRRRGSDVSNMSTIVYGPESRFMDLSSDPPDHGTPDFPRLRNVVVEAPPSAGISPPSSPPDFRSSTRSLSVSFNEIPTVVELPNEESPPRTPMDFSALEDEDLTGGPESQTVPSKMSASNSDDQLRQQISEILESIPAKIKLGSEPPQVNLNPPDFKMPARAKSRPDPVPRAQSSRSTFSSRASSRSGTPSFTLAPAYSRNPRPRIQRGDNQEIKLYHLSRSNGEAPIKLFIRCVGENERVMVRVGGGWADLGEYLKEYATHHGRRSGGEGKVEIRDLPRVSGGSRAGSSPPSRPASAMDASSPITPLNIRKARRSTAGDEIGASGVAKLPRTPLAYATTTTTTTEDTPSSETSTRSRSRSSSRLSWTEEDSSLGMAGPKAKNVEMSEESKAWVESVKEKVRIASGERKVSDQFAVSDGRFGDMGKVGATKRLFRRQV